MPGHYGSLRRPDFPQPDPGGNEQEPTDEHRPEQEARERERAGMPGDRA
jgi:hypothetical protein